MADNWWESDPVTASQPTDALARLQDRGILVTNGLRTPEDTQRIRAQGYKPADNSLHLDRDAVDLTPGTSGMSMAEVEAYARDTFGPDAHIINEDHHIHAQIPGWGAAPDVTRQPELKEGKWWEADPVAASSAKPERLTAPKQADYSEMVGDRADREIIEAGSTTKIEYNEEAEALIEQLLRNKVPYGEAARRVKEAFPTSGAFNAKTYNDWLVYLKEHPKYGGPMAAAPYEVPLSALEAYRNDFAQSDGGALVGNFANAATAGVPVLLAGQEGNDWEEKSFESHPVASWTGAIAGGITGAVKGGQLARGVITPIAEGAGRLAPVAQAVLAKPGAVQAGVDITMGAGYGAATAGPGNRLEGAAIGAGLTAGLELGGRALLRGVAGKVSRANDFDSVAGRAYRPEDAIVGGAETAVGPRSAAMAVERQAGDEIVSDIIPPTGGRDGPNIPLTPRQTYTSAEELAEAARSVDPADVVPNGTSAAGKNGKVANIQLDNIETADDISRLLRETEEAFPMKAARRGKQSHEDTLALADDLKLTPEQLLSRLPGQAMNAEQALAARQILAKSSEEMTVLAERAAVNGGAEDLERFHRALLRHAAIQEQVTGATAEAGRALNQFRITAQASAVRADVLQAVLENKTSLTKIAQGILDLQHDPAALNKFARDAWKPTNGDKLLELYYAAMLSGPQTHAANILGNSIAAGLQPVEHALASVLGGVRAGARKLVGKQTEDRVLMSEVGSRAVGILQGTREGLKSGFKTLTTGETSDAVTKVEMLHQRAISGVKGEIIRAPLKALAAEDEFFKAIARRMEISAMAVRKARGEGLRGDAAKARIAELTENPTDKMMAQAGEYARYMTFQNKLGPVGTKLMGATNDMPILKLFAPFIRTPVNLFKFAAERSPLAPLTKRFRADFRAGGSRRDVAMAKTLIGTGLAMQAYQWAEDGVLTGNGPADKNAKRLLQADGWQPFSIKIGDDYYSYQRLDPLATVIATAADLAEKQSRMTDVQIEDSGALLIGSFIASLENKSFLTGISDVFAALDSASQGMTGKAKFYAQQRIAGTLVPALSSQITQGVDPVQRSVGQDSFTGGIVDAIENRIPGLSDNNLPRRTVLGDEVVRPGSGVARTVNPIRISTDKNDPVIETIQEAGASLGPLKWRIDGVKLTDQQFDDYQKLAGRLTRQYITEEMESDDWDTMSQEDREKAIDDAKKDARKSARESLGIGDAE